MENLLQGSINTVENTSQIANSQQPTVPTQPSESVRFAPESENDERPSHFVRTNTPHPKELMKKKELLKQRNSTTQDLAKQNGETEAPTEETITSQLPVIKTTNDSVNQSPQLPVQQVETTLLSNRQKSKELISQPNSVHIETPIEEPAVKLTETKIEQKEETTEQISNEDENQINRMNNKHVDFKLNFGTDVVIINENEVESSPSLPSSPLKLDEDMNENINQENDTSLPSNGSGGSGQFRLRRRDTPHHLKGARLNSPNNKAQQLDPNEMKEILERYTNNPSTNLIQSAISSAHNGSNDFKSNKPKPASIYAPSNFKHDEIRKFIQLIIQINRQEGAGLGIRIAGGKGSNPYKEDDEGIFITRILPESPAKLTGLKVGDKLLKVNQTSLNDLTHQQAADALKEAVKSGTQMILNVLQELDLNKVFNLNLISNKPN